MFHPPLCRYGGMNVSFKMALLTSIYLQAPRQLPILLFSNNSLAFSTNPPPKPHPVFSAG